MKISEFQCWNAETINVNSKQYCSGYVSRYGGQKTQPLDKCQTCDQWIGNRKTIRQPTHGPKLKPGKYGGLTIKE